MLLFVFMITEKLSVSVSPVISLISKRIYARCDLFDGRIQIYKTSFLKSEMYTSLPGLCSIKRVLVTASEYAQFMNIIKYGGYAY